MPTSDVALLFNWNLSRVSRLPFLGQVFDLDLLLCTVYDSESRISDDEDLFLCLSFTQRPLNY